jgi:glucose-1-phosphate thymidylyltransferase
VAEFDGDGRVVGFEEKPEHPKSDQIPIGVYLFRPSVFDVLGTLQPSARGEFEITDVLNEFIRRGALVSHTFPGEWHDAGTVDSLLSSAAFAAGFAGEVPVRSAHDIEQVAAEPVDPSTVRP